MQNREIKISSLDEKLNQVKVFQNEHTEEYFINMGPQHPATHGVLRLVLKLDGEIVKEVIPVLGYIHRGIEKIAENQSYLQLGHLTDRMDYLSSVMNNWAVARTCEQAKGLVMNDRIETIRTIVAELERIQSHQLWWGVLGMDLGAFTPFLYGFRDREMLTDILEETMGSRLTMNYIIPGGVMFDIHENFIPKVKAFIEYFKPIINEYQDLVGGNIIMQERLRNVGILSPADAVAYGATGPTLRGSGVPYDLRKSNPYGKYADVDFKISVGKTGDCWDRYWIRIEEMRQSLSIIEQLIDNIPDGPIQQLKPGPLSKLKLPEGRYYSEVETARGILGCTFVSTKKANPHRVHFRSPNYNNLWTLIKTAPGSKLGELVAMISTLVLVIPDIDR